MRRANLLVLACVLASCAPGTPGLFQQNVKVPGKFALAPSAELQQAAQSRWWEGLNDSALNRIMERGLNQGLDLKAAGERIKEAEALYRSQGGTAALSGSLTATARVGESAGTSFSNSDVTFNPSYLVDLFGEQRARRDGAGSDLEARIFDAGAARLAYQQSLANTYLDVRFNQTLLQQRRNMIATRRQQIALMKEGLELGSEFVYTLRRAEAGLYEMLSNATDADAGVKRAIFALATLLDEPADPLIKELSAKGMRQPEPKANINPGIPAELLRNRPDIRAAEARIASRVGAFGITEAQLYPSLRIGGSVTVGSTESFSLVPQLTFPILDRGARLARRDAAISQVRQAEIAWRQTVLSAVEEVQTGIVEVRNWDAQVRDKARSVQKYTEVVNFVNEAADLQELTQLDNLEAQNDLSAALAELARARRNHAQSWVQLNVAIGQGWDSQVDVPAKK